MYKNKLLTNLIISVIIGIIEIINIYFAEVILHSYLEKKNIIDKGSLQIVTGSIASILSIFTAFALERTFNIVKHPFVDIFGIFMIMMVYLYLNKYKNKNNKKEDNKDNKKETKNKK